MRLLKLVGIFMILISYGQMIFSAIDDNRYCNLESQCVVDDIMTSKLHIGCKKSFINSPSLYTLIKLKNHDREFIANEFNQFRSDIAMGEYSKIFKYPLKPMNKLEWSNELEYLLSLMISKVPNTNFYCMATEISKRPSQLYVLMDRLQPFNLRKVFTLFINKMKVKALESFRDANIGDKVNWSQIYDTDTWAIGCAIGEYNSINVNDKLLIRCSFYGSKHEKQNVTTVNRSSVCHFTKRNSESFPGLCEKDNLKDMRGDPGDSGVTGLPGIVGQKGERGVEGLLGDLGTNGDAGVRGSSGDRGRQGEPGKSQNDGLQGDEGEKGECLGGLSGIPGLSGNPGPPGKIGLKGKKGKKGQQGESVSLATLKGDQGRTVIGPKGNKGDKGEKGIQGAKGVRGPTGLKGEAGTLDYEGDKCITCPASKQGKQGPPGPPGLPGPPGTLKITCNRVVTIDKPFDCC